ncbi:MAG: PEP-CTERM sorting domain-containing protein [Gammaproteobacteria bacterium]|nr:PEP-CTERM sorting domain-containing protein [Gammaproteobacteria bacterium]
MLRGEHDFFDCKYSRGIDDMKKLLGMLILSFSMVTTVQAGAISGELQLMGTGKYVGGTDYSNATGLDFNFLGIFDDKAMVTRATGGFSGFSTPGSFIDMYDITFNALGDVWQMGTLKFSLLSISGVGTEVISGIGKVTDSAIGGFADTIGSFDLKLSGGGTSFTFASSTSVPEPGTIFLMGLGVLFIVGGALVRSKKDEQSGDFVVV